MCFPPRFIVDDRIHEIRNRFDNLVDFSRCFSRYRVRMFLLTRRCCDSMDAHAVSHHRVGPRTGRASGSVIL
jgi:uncharacterized membrane protein YjdF